MAHSNPFLHLALSPSLTLTPTLTLTLALTPNPHQAFVASPLPVTLSFEMHCSAPQQVRIVEICREVMGDTLLAAAELKDLAAAASAAGRELTLSDLRGRIIVKVRVRVRAWVRVRARVGVGVGV